MTTTLTASTITDDELDMIRAALAEAHRRIAELELDVAQLRWINAKLATAVPDA